ncbi:sortase [Terrabacter sp. NPDC080008]|uniref:sortase domain-containing protein n=1 Tax=Terrabacter sp. NPDC080008 TaxID=3155176 RepID=UPI0034503EF7
MSEHAPSRRSGRLPSATVAALAATVVLILVGAVALVLGSRGDTRTPRPPQPAAAGVVPTTSPVTGPSARATGAPGKSVPAPPGRGGTTASGTGGIGTFLEASEPTSIEIPSIGVRSSRFVPLEIQRDGTISVPGTTHEVGLYDAGPTPGQLGPAVLAAHVDAPSGAPGIFYRLGRVKAGDVVRISRRDGSHLTFTVDRVAAFRKSEFPTALVYKGDFTRAEIRLVTCGGPTDSRNEYRDNVVVFGHLTSAT